MANYNFEPKPNIIYEAIDPAGIVKDFMFVLYDEGGNCHWENGWFFYLVDKGTKTPWGRHKFFSRRWVGGREFKEIKALTRGWRDRKKKGDEEWAKKDIVDISES